MNGHLDHKHELILESLLTGSLPRNIRWDDVVELIGKIGAVEPHGGVEFAFAIGSQRAFFKRPNTHNLQVSEVSRLRRFLHEAGHGADPTRQVRLARAIVVIDHHLARIFQEFDGKQPGSEVGIKPYDPHGFHRHLVHRQERHYEGQRVPEEPSYYEEIAKDLVAAQEIVMIGHGTGTSSALDFLAEFLKKRHPAIYERVISTETVDLSATTEPEIEAMAREYL